ncbi:hypothetical protein LSH36_364g05037 [Paralvinella palmiformis]|uniref:Uncharacterized protein n=1 Tax=Paralvinella palmiformis TaxID=53620 RepID=A0AAD9N241_9ANNE|nr:hypothetical protein LSH36_364g05037 [Paralvinella palmiformis]
MYKNSAKGSYSAVPMEATITSEKQKEIKPVMFNTTTQTDDPMNAPFLGDSALEKKSSPPERRSSLPSQLNRPNRRTASNDLPRPRLTAISATPDMDANRRQPNVAVINAVVESDPEQHSKRSSPSQSSKTESAHGHLDQHPGSARVPSADDTDLGSKDDLSLDIDLRSDYDNQPPSDMEVNLESEADVRGLDASGDELDDGSGPPMTGLGRMMAAPPDPDSSDSDSDETGSSIGEERALFQQLQTNPRVRALQEDASLSDRDSTGNLSWDEFQHQPSFTVDPRQYAFNPYALDNDIMSNRYFPDAGRHLHSSQGKGLDEYDHELPYDPDPDATVV